MLFFHAIKRRLSILKEKDLIANARTRVKHLKRGVVQAHLYAIGLCY
jgi:hypothetical protein